MRRLMSSTILLCLAFIVAAGSGLKAAVSDQKMKEIGSAFGSLKKNLEAKKGPEAAADAQKLAALFKNVESFWKGRKAKDAIAFAKGSRKASLDAAKAAKANNFEQTATAVASLGKNCKGCHEVHREKLPDGTYKTK